MPLGSIDETDRQILDLLLKDSTLSHREIGIAVHLTGQAVGARIRKMMDHGIIEGYTLLWNPAKIGLAVEAFVTVFMNSGQAHQGFQDFVKNKNEIVEMHRVSGEGCYWLRVRTVSAVELNTLLDELLKFGNYKLSLSIGQVK
ncbi:Lrp/AsnC family transcriptional regulator [Paenibacillus sp. J22TS3]|uniref:Lrp/AsnC family transcriptional regulator n=1 Tax=Paenibacillus sp. J22TS3 TaxID=2807192 RepID=UPI001B21D0EA|nr:Lrp/AsnC family transcriptional regulator [Paenibacillus sp. J22TS3]GIP24473.1 HTH-type transcriptional regulator LrpB [Paenibacillus sp. J22TS3]